MQEDLNITEICIYRQPVDMFCQLSGVSQLCSFKPKYDECEFAQHLLPKPPPSPSSPPPRLSGGFALSSDSSSRPAALREDDEDEEEDGKMRREKRLPSSLHLLAFPPRAWIYTYVIVQAFPMFIVPAGDTLLNTFSSSKRRKGTVAGKEEKKFLEAARGVASRQRNPLTCSRLL